MEFGTREILILLGILVIVAILLDGVRRVRRSRSGKLRSGRRRQPIFDDEPFDDYGSELPSGGARVVQVRDPESTEKLTEQMRRKTLEAGTKVTSAFHKRQTAGGPTEPSPGGEAAAEKPFVAEPVVPRQAPKTPPPDSDADATPKAPQQSEPSAAVEPGSPRPATQTARERPKPAEDEREEVVLLLHVMAGDEHFAGPELLRVLLDNRMRYGAMKIFHRHENADGSGPVLFSLANSINPGTFDLNAMEDFSTPGVTLFMTLKHLDRPMEAFDEMMTVARNLARELDGELKDETRSAFTRQTAEHYRQRILEHTRRSFTLSS